MPLQSLTRAHSTSVIAKEERLWQSHVNFFSQLSWNIKLVNVGLVSNVNVFQAKLIFQKLPVIIRVLKIYLLKLPRFFDSVENCIIRSPIEKRK